MSNHPYYPFSCPPVMGNSLRRKMLILLVFSRNLLNRSCRKQDFPTFLPYPPKTCSYSTERGTAQISELGTAGFQSWFQHILIDSLILGKPLWIQPPTENIETRIILPPSGVMSQAHSTVGRPQCIYRNHYCQAYLFELENLQNTIRKKIGKGLLAPVYQKTKTTGSKILYHGLSCRKKKG